MHSLRYSTYELKLCICNVKSALIYLKLKKYNLWYIFRIILEIFFNNLNNTLRKCFWLNTRIHLHHLKRKV